MNRLQKAFTMLGIVATLSAWGMIPSFAANRTLFSIATANPGLDEPDGIGVRSELKGVQVLPLPLTAPYQLAQSNPAPGTDDSLADELDINLLARTIANLIESEHYQTESQMQFSFNAGVLNGEFSVLIKTIAKSPQEFKTEIYPFGLGEVEQPKYVLVSNGEQVWIYHTESQQYQVTDYASFDSSKDNFFIGFSSLLFLQMSSSFREEFPEDLITVDTIIEGLESLLSVKNVPLEGSQMNLQGQDYYAYKYKDKQAGFTFTVLVEPTTAQVNQLQMSGISDGIDIKMTETIMNRVASPVVTADTFVFTPPPGATEVESLEIDIF